MTSPPTAEQEDPASGAFDAIDAAVTTLLASDPTRRSVAEHKQFLVRTQQVINRLPALQHREIAALRQQASPAELGATVSQALADLLRISRSAALRLVADTDNLGPRIALDGQPLQPWLAETAAAQAQGALSAEQVAVIRDFHAQLPGHVSVAERDAAEATLVAKARTQRPEELRKDGRDLFLQLDQDGQCPTDPTPRAPRGEFKLGPQRKDGSRTFSGTLTAEAAATWEPIWARWAAPGACNPGDESPSVDEVGEQAAARDGRSQAQRHHDAFVAVGRSVLASGELGTHHGLPATIIVSTTLAELENTAGLGVTAGGTRLPIADALRLARHAHHYLVIYGDQGQVLHLGRTRRTANPAQQIVLYDRDRGCTKPGCTVPGYGCEAHHAVLDWANGGLTNIDDLAFACPPHNKLVTEGGWSTRKNLFGETEWIPPAHLDYGQPRTNDYHHPERLRHPRRNADPPSRSEPPQTGRANPLPHNRTGERPPAGRDDGELP